MSKLNSMQAEAILDAAIAHLTQEARDRELDYLRFSHPDLDAFAVASHHPDVTRSREEYARHALKDAKRAIVLCREAREMKEALHNRNLGMILAEVLP